MDNKKKLFLDASNFLWAEVLIMISGFISFPILTRIFSQEQYGLFSLIGVTISILMGVSSLGLSRSLLRFYDRYKISHKQSSFLSTLTITVLLSGAAFIICSMVVYGSLSLKWKTMQYALLPVSVALAWMVLQNIFVLFNTVFRMEGWIFQYNINGIVRKYGSLMVAIPLVIYFGSLTSFYIAMISVEIGLIIMLYLVMKNNLQIHSLTPGLFSKDIFAESISYGIPLALTALPYIILNIGDRYIITAFWGAEEVAVYSAGYNLCMYLKEMIVSPLYLALLPLMFKFWEMNKVEEIREILSLVIRYLMMIAIPICFLSILVSKDIMILLATEKYARSAEIIPIILAGIFIQALDFPLSPGLHFAKKTKTFLYIMSTASAFNIILNFLVVPVHGIMGAAVVSLLSYIAYTVAYYYTSRKYFVVTIPYKMIIKYFVLSMIWFGVTRWYAGVVEIDNNLLKAMTIIVIFITGYSISLFFIDASIRKNIHRIFELIVTNPKNRP